MFTSDTARWWLNQYWLADLVDIGHVSFAALAHHCPEGRGIHHFAPGSVVTGVEDVAGIVTPVVQTGQS